MSASEENKIRHSGRNHPVASEEPSGERENMRCDDTTKRNLNLSHEITRRERRAIELPADQKRAAVCEPEANDHMNNEQICENSMQIAIDKIGDPLECSGFRCSFAGATGPNSLPVRFNAQGDQIGGIIHDQNGEEIELIILRNRNTIREAYDECRDKVWWNRHQNWKLDIEEGIVTLTPGEMDIFRTACKEASRIEEKYGLAELDLDDFHLGLLNGRMSALGWVLGMDWADSLET